jgi:polysaccharide biosynthesis/export protein
MVAFFSGKLKIIYFLGVIFLVSCSPSRNLVYLSDLPAEEVKAPALPNQPLIQPHDVLSITVSSMHPESNLLFNSGVLQVAGTSSSGAAPARLNDGYQVGTEGTINFPVLGKVVLAGLSREEAADKLGTQISRYVKDPVVNVRFQNFRITVIGEVTNPATFTVPTERVNVLEAIGMAGDLTPFGKRENVLLIREKDGERSTTRLNLNNQDLLTSPFFYLRQNDVLYVEPVKARGLQANSTRANLTFGLSMLSALTIVLWRLGIF